MPVNTVHDVALELAKHENNVRENKALFIKCFTLEVSGHLSIVFSNGP